MVTIKEDPSSVIFSETRLKDKEEERGRRRRCQQKSPSVTNVTPAPSEKNSKEVEGEEVAAFIISRAFLSSPPQEG